jgi:hypothetical protein
MGIDISAERITTKAISLFKFNGFGWLSYQHIRHPQDPGSPYL